MTQPEVKWWYVRWGLVWRSISRPAIIVAKVMAVLCLVAAIGYGVLYLNSPWLQSRRLGKIDPRLHMVPAELPTRTQPPSSHETIDRYGFRVSLPKEQVLSTYGSDLSTLVSFRNGSDLMFENPSMNSGAIDIAINDINIQKFVEQESRQSKFNLMQAAMTTTPDDVQWWGFRTRANKRVLNLLITKFLVLVSHSGRSFTLGPIYRISAGRFRGFQIRNPEAAPYEAHLDLFDESDRHLAFDIYGPENHGPVLTQAEINALVASIQSN